MTEFHAVEWDSLSHHNRPCTPSQPLFLTEEQSAKISETLDDSRAAGWRDLAAGVPMQEEGCPVNTFTE